MSDVGQRPQAALPTKLVCPRIRTPAQETSYDRRMNAGSGMVLGTGVGMVFGIIFGHMVLGMIFGTAFGMIFGIAVARRRSRTAR